MQLRYVAASLGWALAALTACAPELGGPGDGSLLDVLAGLTGGDGSNSKAPQDSGPGAPVTAVSGTVAGHGDYELFELGPVLRGDQLTVTSAGGLLSGGSFLVVLLDEDRNLLRREILSSGAGLRHIVRAASANVYLGVTPPFGRTGGEFRLSIARQAGVAVPPPQRQRVWLNFAGASGVQVHRRTGISFPAFDGGLLGADYAGATAALKAAIVAAMRQDYADYQVTILTSDDGPPPEEPHATLHFGHYDGRLLGLADSVDQYNEDIWQSAIIYVESFADFAVMGLSAEEMGQMIANVASHELGHLLGLFHTQVPADVMDTTGTAWDLAADQSFLRGELEPTVFPTGYEDSPARLADTVGVRLGPKAGGLARPLSPETMQRKAALRALVREELRCRCGNCLNPDE